MKQALIVAAALSLLLPGMSIAQSDQLAAPGNATPSKPGGRPATPNPRPGNPGAPGNPRPPGNPGAPGNPSGPGKPGAPGNPSGPGNPRPPGNPNAPGNPRPPGNPNGPGKPNPPGRPPRPPQPQPGPKPPTPSPGRPPHAGPPGPHRPPPYVRPLPPRGNQFWHRGQYYGRIPGPAYAYPPGWHYRQWMIGARLPPVFLAPTYFFQGWAALGLEAPVPGYAWVRFGPDLLLVNLSTNEVEDVVYGVFLP